MSSTVEFIVYLEDPGIDIEVIRDEFCELLKEIVLIIDVVCTNWYRNISHLKDSLGTRLRGKDLGLLGIARKDWY